mgnify:CR=1 FL=1
MVHHVGQNLNAIKLVNNSTLRTRLENRNFCRRRHDRKQIHPVVRDAICVIRGIDGVEAAGDLLKFLPSIDRERLVPAQNPASAHHFPDIGNMIRLKMGQEHGVDVRDWQAQILHGILGTVARIEQADAFGPDFQIRFQIAPVIPLPC